MAKTRSRKTQENATWKAFSKYIRARDAIRTTGTLANVECFTCGQILPTGASQAGHIVSRAFNGALFNEKVVFAQCAHCNLHREGMHVFGFLNLVSLVGFDRAEAIVLDSIRPRPLTMFDLEDLEDGCELALEVLEQFYETNAR